MGSLVGLYKKMSNYEKEEIRRDTKKVCSDAEMILTSEKLKEYLRKEAR